MNRFEKIPVLMLILLLLGALILPSFANSAEPPAVVIIVENAPADLEITLKDGDFETAAHKTNKVIETYYAFYSREFSEAPKHNLQVSTGGQAFQVPLVLPVQTYNTLLTLNLKTHTLTEGKRPIRTAMLVSLRVGLTLLLEGAVFYLLGFRNKRTWLAFIGINLLTQGALNLWLSDMVPLQSYAILALIWGEFFVFIAEIIAFNLLVKEKSALRVIGTVVLANAFSLFAGGWLITVLPL